MFRIYFINPLTFIIFLLTYDFLKFIFIRNIFIDLVVIRGEYMGKFSGFSISSWSVTGIGEKFCSKWDVSFYEVIRRFFDLFLYVVWFFAKRNSSSTSLASLAARLIASAFLLKYSFFNLSLNFFTSWSNLRQLSYFLHLFLSSIRWRKVSLTQGLLSVERFFRGNMCFRRRLNWNSNLFT